MNNSGYSANELLSMQKDAIRRVREMQKRANGHLQTPAPQANPPAPVSSAPPAASKAEPPAKLQKSGGMEILKSLGIDDERAMILLLAILLAREGADQKLILALLYLIM